MSQEERQKNIACNGWIWTEGGEIPVVRVDVQTTHDLGEPPCYLPRGLWRDQYPWFTDAYVTSEQGIDYPVERASVLYRHAKHYEIRKMSKVAI